MIDAEKKATVESGSVAEALIQEILKLSNSSDVLEIGCGSGRFYDWLRQGGFVGSYTGIEPGLETVNSNAQTYPSAKWLQASADNLPFDDNRFDCVFSHYVIEHCVRPEKAISEMLRVTKPGGKILAAFPDFVALGHVPSQVTGFQPGRAVDKIRNGRLIDGLVSLIDSKYRVRRALKNKRKIYGRFPINLSPACLSYPAWICTDFDAVYVADKGDWIEFAKRNGLKIEFPRGIEGLYDINAFLSLEKPLT